MKTKDKILNESLALCNEYGLAHVSLRQIAQRVGISQGNLTYHFKHKEDLVEALYFQLVEEMNQQIAAFEAAPSGLDQLHHLTLLTMRAMYKYRFLMMEFSIIMQENSKIRTHYEELRKLRNLQFMNLFGQLVKEGLMRPAEFSKEYERFYERLNILGDHWIAVYTTFDRDKSIEHFSSLILESIYPYLTIKGKEAYLQTIAK